MPTTRFGKVRRLLKNKKAKVIRSCPFTIKLFYEPESLVMQEVVLGQDTGSKYVGVACVANDKVLYQSEVALRDNIKKKMDNRRAFRKNRRQRKARYRKPRFLNRANSTKKDRLPPSVKSKGIRGQLKISVGKIQGFRKFDKVKYLKREYFIKGRASSGFAVLMNIFNEKIDFSHLPRGWKTPKLSNLKRISARSSCLCISQRV